jgi:hypothetical protein
MAICLFNGLFYGERHLQLITDEFKFRTCGDEMSVAGLYSQVPKLSLSTPRRRRGGVKVEIHSILTSAALLPVLIRLEDGGFDQEKNS